MEQHSANIMYTAEQAEHCEHFMHDPQGSERRVDSSSISVELVACLTNKMQLTCAAVGHACSDHLFCYVCYERYNGISIHIVNQAYLFKDQEHQCVTIHVSIAKLEFQRTHTLCALSTQF